MTGQVALLVLLFADGTALATEERAGAWDRSVEREIAGELSEAENIMTRAWGRSSDNYWVALRLAYLALLQGALRRGGQPLSTVARSSRGRIRRRRGEGLCERNRWAA